MISREFILVFELGKNSLFFSRTVQLTQQHRMRTSIADTLMTHFYPALTNHSTTYDRPAIRGVDLNVAFIDHDQLEESGFDFCGFMRN